MTPVARPSRPEQVGRALALVALAIALGALSGWALDQPLLTRLSFEYASTKFNTAISLAALAIGLACSHRTAVTSGLGAAALGLGLATLSQDLGGWNLGIDELLVRDHGEPFGTVPPGRMGPTTAAGVALLGAALLTLDRETPRGWRPAQMLSLMAGGLSVVAILNYAYGTRFVYGAFERTEMAVPTAVMIGLLAAGVMLARPDRGLALIVMSDSAISSATRWLLGAGFLIPLVLGWARLWGEREGFLGPTTGTALLSAGSAGLFISLVLWTSTTLTRWHAEREESMRALASSEARLRAAETQMTLKSQELERSNAELEQFAAVVSHDLNEPLRTVASYTQLLERRYAGRLDSDADEFIAFTREAALRMRTLIDDLRTLARVSTRGRPFATVALEAVLTEVVTDLGTALAQAGAKVTHDRLPEVLGDATQLRQLFQNLLANALKFSGQAPPRIHVGAEASLGMWRLSVSDNGIGIEASKFERIFVIFQRLHTEAEYPGTGLGLALCKKIVTRHGGTIWVESDVGAGSTFSFTLPSTLVADPSPASSDDSN